MRTVQDANRRTWKAELISHGQTSDYLNPRVHKPIIQFTCLDGNLPRRYVAFRGSDERSLDQCAEEELVALFQRAVAH